MDTRRILKNKKDLKNRQPMHAGEQDLPPRNPDQDKYGNPVKVEDQRI
jgi:hypothetical protein